MKNEVWTLILSKAEIPSYVAIIELQYLEYWNQCKASEIKIFMFCDSISVSATRFFLFWSIRSLTCAILHRFIRHLNLKCIVYIEQRNRISLNVGIGIITVLTRTHCGTYYGTHWSPLPPHHETVASVRTYMSFYTTSTVNCWPFHFYLTSYHNLVYSTLFCATDTWSQ